MTSIKVDLSPEALTGLFPFHLAWNDNLELVQFGNVVGRIFPELGLGVRIDKCFRFRSPRVAFVTSEILEQLHSTFLLENLRRAELVLRGQIIYDLEENYLLFLGSPIVQSFEQIEDFGLTFQDFALHDSVGEFIFSLQVKETALADARRMFDAARASERAKAEFLAAMSHETRTPMNGIIGMIDLMTETHMADDQRKMLSTIKDSAFSLLNIINNILDFSRIEAGKMTLEKNPVSIRDVMCSVADTLLPNAAEKGVDLLSFTDPRIPAFVLGDQVRLRQILLNLGGNAVKFSTKGRVLIRAGFVDSQLGRVNVRYEVIDQGIGIPADKIPELFQPFSQADFSNTRKFGGTGLGLSICKSLTDLMGGEIGVESEPGVGSTFWCTLHHDIDTRADETDVMKSLHGVRVLIVTADTDRRGFMQCYLEHWQAEVTTIDDPARVETLMREAAAAGNAFDVVVQGADWPERAGAAFRERVQSDPALSATRFVELCTDSVGLAANGVTLAASPLRREQVLEAVANAASGVSVEASDKKDASEADTPSAAPTVEEAEARGELILVAEDNPVNQDVIGRQLGVLGYVADIEPNGQAAFEAWQRKDYAMLLTDCHMPELDGYGLTAAIRKAERNTDKRFPIIAITANALQGEAERCLEAGMDDFLSKPLPMNRLRRALKKWMPRRKVDAHQGAAESPEPGAGESKTADDSGAIDLSFLIDCFGDDEETHRDILQEFAGSTGDYVGKILEALDGDSAKEIASQAHAFKSAARTVGAHELADLCQKLEYAGKADNWEEIRTVAPRLTPAMDKVTKFIAAF